MTTPQDRELIRAALLALIDSLSPCTVVVIPPCGCPQTFQLPALPPPDGEETGCAQDILYVLGEAGQRLTTPQVLDALSQAGLIHGEGTVKLALARLVKEGRLENRPDARPRGYTPTLTGGTP